MGLSDREYYRDEQTGFGQGGPWSIVAILIAINVAVFVADAVSPPLAGPGSSHVVANALSLKTDVIQKPYNIWQLLTSGFAHASIGTKHGINHILFNMVGLFFFGRFSESRYGRLGFLRIYLIAIVLAGLVWLACNAHKGPGYSCLGASGAVTTVLILFILHNPKATILVMFVIPVPAWLVGVFLVGMNVYGEIASTENIAFVAHLAGAAWGAFVFFKNPNLSRVLPDWLFTPGRWFERRKPALKVHRPTDVDPPREDVYRQKDEEADRVLEKLHTQGEDSLTASERKTLEDYSRRMRQKHR